mgnify:CR=1 FL=1
MPPKILIFHHDRVYEALLADFLVFCNYVVCPVYSHTDAIEQTQKTDFDLVVLDLGNESDLALIEHFQKEKPDLASLPVPLVDILTLVRTLLEKQETQKLNARAPIQLGDLVIDTVTSAVTFQGKPLTLTVTEFSLLSLLANHCNEAVSKDEIYPTVLGRPSIRHKLQEAAGTQFSIESVRGVGYRFKA